MWKPGNHASEKTYTLIIHQQYVVPDFFFTELYIFHYLARTWNYSWCLNTKNTRNGFWWKKKNSSLIFFSPSRSKNYCRAHINVTDISEKIRIYENDNMIAEVFENSESTNCTKAVFKASPKSLCKFTKQVSFSLLLMINLWWISVHCLYVSVRCGPPCNVSFSRHSGRLVVNVRWQQVDMRDIKYYSVRYKALGSLLWNQVSIKFLIWNISQGALLLKLKLKSYF